jgi:hypothetical protein
MLYICAAITRELRSDKGIPTLKGNKSKKISKLLSVMVEEQATKSGEQWRNYRTVRSQLAGFGLRERESETARVNLPAFQRAATRSCGLVVLKET